MHDVQGRAADAGEGDCPPGRLGFGHGRMGGGMILGCGLAFIQQPFRQIGDDVAVFCMNHYE